MRRPKFAPKKRNAFVIPRKRFCRFCVNKVKTIDYKDTKLMESFITEKGKILSRRISGNCARHQRRIAEAIKRSRFISLVPYVRI
jgi:small subunit ribosomal protein S18